MLITTNHRYSCEVSADAPSFDTKLVSGDLEVVGKCKKLTATICRHQVN